MKTEFASKKWKIYNLEELKMEYTPQDFEKTLFPVESKDWYSDENILDSIIPKILRKKHIIGIFTVSPTSMVNHNYSNITNINDNLGRFVLLTPGKFGIDAEKIKWKYYKITHYSHTDDFAISLLSKEYKTLEISDIQTQRETNFHENIDFFIELRIVLGYQKQKYSRAVSHLYLNNVRNCVYKNYQKLPKLDENGNLIISGNLTKSAK